MGTNINNLARLRLLIVIALILNYPVASLAQDGDFTWQCESGDDPVVTVDKLESGHLVNWNCGAESSLASGLTLKGYEIDYAGESQYLTYGASGDSWLDNIESHHALNPYTVRCSAENYQIRAVTKKQRGSQFASNWVSAIADELCNTVPNEPPVARITAPVNVDLDSTFELVGAGSFDPDGEITDWSWESTTGVEIVNSNQSDTLASISEMGLYTITLTVTDNDGDTHTTSVPVEAVANGDNQPPVVDAGQDSNLALIDGEITALLVGTISDDGRPENSVLTQMWALDSTSDCGASSCDSYVTWANQDALSTSATISATGIYVFSLTGYDGDEFSTPDTVQVVVSENTGGLGELVWIGEDTTTTTPDFNPGCPVTPTYFNRGLMIDADNPLWATEFNTGDWQKDGNNVVRWNTAYTWGPETIINNESQYYVDVLGIHPTSSTEWSPFIRVDGDGINNGKANEGYLVIQAAPTEFAGRTDLGPAGTTQDYLSGVMTSREQVGGDLTYGYFESRLRAAPGNGTWTAFWLNHTSFRKTNEPEADIIEYLGQSKQTNGSCDKQELVNETGNIVDDNYCLADHPTYVNSDGDPVNNKTYNTYDTQYHTYWYGKGRREERSALHYTNRDIFVADPANPGAVPISDEWCGTRVNFSEEFHTYGFLWAADRMVWYIDDIEVMRVAPSDLNADTSDMPIAAENMYLILNLALGKDLLPWESWPGKPDSWTREQFNASGFNKISMAIDYVRVYSLK